MTYKKNGKLQPGLSAWQPWVGLKSYKARYDSLMESKEEPGFFSDESSFQLFPTTWSSNGWTETRRGLQTSFLHSLCIWWRARDNLVVLLQGWDGVDFHFLKDASIKPCAKLCWRKTFQHDSVPCHTARSIRVWMKDHKIKTLSCAVQSLYLNLIKNLKNVMKRKMDGQKP